MALEFKIKPFTALSVVELYQVLQLRSEVFVVEQDCVYLDIDGKDSKAFHLLGFENDTLVAYARIFKPGDYFANASIGRVVVAPAHRDKKFGHVLMKAAIAAVHGHCAAETITISAQQYLTAFYQSHGFVITSEPYLEDDIPHIEMQRG
jgi:ElaA protein